LTDLVNALTLSIPAKPAESSTTPWIGTARLRTPSRSARGRSPTGFNDPAGGTPKGNAPVALFMPLTGTSSFRHAVTVEFLSDFDAGTLFIYADECNWAKLCFEVSPQRQPMVVSVVTRGLSDDCNGVPINGKHGLSAYSPQEDVWAFHYSLDGQLVAFLCAIQPGHCLPKR